MPSKQWSGSVPQCMLGFYSTSCSPQELTGMLLGSCLACTPCCHPARISGMRQRYTSRLHPELELESNWVIYRPGAKMSSQLAQLKCSHREHKEESRKLQSQMCSVQDLTVFSEVLIMVSDSFQHNLLEH